MCDLYFSMAGVGAGGEAPPPGTAAVGGRATGAIGGGAEGGEGARTSLVPIPGAESTAKLEQGGGRGGAHPEGVQLRPAAAVRCRCLEGALRSLLETRSVFADAGVDDDSAVPNGAGGETSTLRLRRLMNGVLERVPKVMHALVRASVEIELEEASSSSLARHARHVVGGTAGAGDISVANGGKGTASSKQTSRSNNNSVLNGVRETAISSTAEQMLKKRSTVFKSMYRRSLVGLGRDRQERDGAQAVLAALAVEYEAVDNGEGYDDRLQ